MAAFIGHFGAYLQSTNYWVTSNAIQLDATQNRTHADPKWFEGSSHTVCVKCAQLNLNNAQAATIPCECRCVLFLSFIPLSIVSLQCTHKTHYYCKSISNCLLNTLLLLLSSTLCVAMAVAAALSPGTCLATRVQYNERTRNKNHHRVVFSFVIVIILRSQQHGTT